MAQDLEQAVVDMLLLGEYVQHTESISSGAKKLGSMEMDVGVSITTTDGRLEAEMEGTRVFKVLTLGQLMCVNSISFNH